MKRHLAATFLIVALAAVVGVTVSTASTRTRGATTIQQLNVGFVEQGGVGRLDPSRVGASFGEFYSLGLESLTMIGTDLKVHPWLAQSVTQPTPATYDYHLRKGVKFWDGHQLTATDVADALNYYRYPKSATAFSYGAVRNIKALNRYTVQITLKHPVASWPFDFANAGVAGGGGGIFENSARQANPNAFGEPGSLPIGTGPFEYVSLDPTSGLQLKANPNYWGGKVSPRNLSIKFFSDENSEALALRSGAIDLAIPPLDAAFTSAVGFAAAAGTQVTSIPGAYLLLLSLPTQTPPWNDIHVRRAVAYVLNRSDITAANGSGGVPETWAIPPRDLLTFAPTSAVDALLKTEPTYPYSLQKARAEMAQSATPNGFTADLNTANAFSYPQMGQVLAAQLAQIGITLNIHILPISQWIATLSGPKDKTGLQWVEPERTTLDPSAITAKVMGSKNVAPGHLNLANWGPPAVDDLITRSEETVDPLKRLAIYGKIENALATDLPYIGVMITNKNMAISSKFTWPTFNAQWALQPWALQIKPR